MRNYAIVSTIALFSAIFLGCRTETGVAPAITPSGASSLAIQSVIATPTVVPVGASAVIECNVLGDSGRALTYQWTGSGAVGSLWGMDSICVFSSPSCHSGRATIYVNVQDDLGRSAADSVTVN